jgi:hypothetical protein
MEVGEGRADSPFGELVQFGARDTTYEVSPFACPVLLPVGV